MSYPNLADYTQAVRDYPHISILDPKLKSGAAKRGPTNHLVSVAGGFSIVFPFTAGSNAFALRCWTRDIEDVETRYQGISNYLKQKSLPYFVEFEYVPEGILVNGIKWPITRMEWAEGETLCQFIEDNLHDAGLLQTAAAEFLKMVETLHGHQISHGDLQDGNILLKRNGPDVAVKLIDYDSVFVPSLQGYPDNIVGLPEYQHPHRIAGGGTANARLDYFSELVIYLSLLSLAEKPGLWSQFGQRTERSLLFVEADFKNATQSDVLQELENLSSDVKLLASKLKDFCAKTSIDQLEPLEVLLPRTDLTAKKAYNQGLAFLHSEGYNEAIAEFDKAIRIDSRFKEAHHGLGLAYLKIGNLESAKKKAEETLRIDVNYQPARELLETVKQKQVNIQPNPASSKQPGSRTSSHPTSSRTRIRHFLSGGIPVFSWRPHYFYLGLISVCAICVVIILLTRNGPTSVSVSINAVPWAEVLIKLPRANSYIKPQKIHFNIPPDSSERKPNFTPIRGGLSVPIGTTIKLSYRGTDKIFPYDTWKETKAISYDFLNP